MLVVLVSTIATFKWFCLQVNTQYQIIHDILNKMNDTSGTLYDLKNTVSRYWEENHHHCFHDTSQGF